MKILKRTTKQFHKEDVESLFGFKDFNENDNVLAEIQIPFESKIAQANVEYINKNMSQDDETIDYLIENNQEDLDEFPVIMYREYLSLGIEYYTKVKDGKICREAVYNDALKEVTTKYDVAIGPVDMESDDEQIALCQWYPAAALDIWDYESINEVAPNIFKTLLDNGYVEIVDIEDEEGDED